MGFFWTYLFHKTLLFIPAFCASKHVNVIFDTSLYLEWEKSRHLDAPILKA